MGYTFTLSDVTYLTSDAARPALAAASARDLNDRSLIGDLTRLRAEFGDLAVAVVETVSLRRKAVGRISNGENWLFTADALQQASATLVARHRAQRLAGRVVHDVTCSVGADLAALTEVADRVIGSDLDPVRIAMARHNVPAAAFVRADALTPTTRDTVVIADPGRRLGGRRTHNPADLQPPLPELLEVYSGRDLAVKCAPGLDFDDLGWPGEVEVVSLDGGVREACLWSRGLSGARRRASVLSSAGPGWTLTDKDPDELPDREVGRWIINPDGAVVRAGLVRQFAARHRLWQLDPRIAYVTGDELPPGERGFEVVACTRFDERTIRKELVARDCGSLEILARGVTVDPDVLRRKLKQRGTKPHTLVITRIGSQPVAFICGPGVRATSG